MRALALGGCGQMGRVAVETALRGDLFDHIVIADRDLASASELAAQLGERVEALGLDVQDTPALLAAMREADVVVNTVGPYYRFGVPILKAAIEARCDYIDINDDWEPTLEMLALDEEARERGVTAIIGVGASPGVSNLLAAAAMARLEEVDTLITGWGGDDDDIDIEAGATAALEHWLHQCSGTIRVVSDGELRDVKPLQKRTLDFPGLGPLDTWTVGHPEPVTLCRFRPELRESVNVMWMPRAIIALVKGLAKLIDWRALSIRNAAKILAFLERIDAGKAVQRIERPAPKRDALALFALAEGRREGQRVRIGAHLSSLPRGGMAELTGIPLAVGLELLARGDVTRHGVAAPEAVFDPERFFEALAAHCPAPPDGSPLLVVTEQLR